MMVDMFIGQLVLSDLISRNLKPLWGSVEQSNKTQKLVLKNTKNIFIIFTFKFLVTLFTFVYHFISHYIMPFYAHTSFMTSQNALR